MCFLVRYFIVAYFEGSVSQMLVLSPDRSMLIAQTPSGDHFLEPVSQNVANQVRTVTQFT